VDLNHPTQFVPMADGTLTLVAWHNHKLRRYDPATGRVTVTCGGAAGFGGDGGPARMAKLNQPSALIAAEDGTQYLVDQRNQVIRSIDPDGIVSTIAGTPTVAGFEGDGGPADACKFSWPAGNNPPPGGGLALDGGTLYVSDTLNHRIRAIDLESGEITTLAGTGEAGFSGDGQEASEAQLNFPRKLTIGPDRRLYVGDQQNHRIQPSDPRDRSRQRDHRHGRGQRRAGLRRRWRSRRDGFARSAVGSDVRRGRRDVRTRYLQLAHPARIARARTRRRSELWIWVLGCIAREDGLELDRCALAFCP
jgi:hypothetical protein